MSVATLDALHNGQDGIVLLLNVNKELFHRLSALGVRAGKTIRMIRRYRSTGPLHIRVGTTEIMLRQQDARCIQLQILAKHHYFSATSTVADEAGKMIPL